MPRLHIGEEPAHEHPSIEFCGADQMNSEKKKKTNKKRGHTIYRFFWLMQTPMRNATSRKLIDNHRWDFPRILVVVRRSISILFVQFTELCWSRSKYVLHWRTNCGQQVLFSLSDRWWKEKQQQQEIHFCERKKRRENQKKNTKWIWCGDCWTCAMKPHIIWMEN